MVDFGDKFLHAAEGSPANGLLRDAIEPDLHLIQPGCIGRGKVHMEAGARGKPAPDSQMLVGGVISPRRSSPRNSAELANTTE